MTSQEFWQDVLPNWLLAVTAVGAFIAAIYAARISFRLLENDDKREQMRLDIAEKEQAEKVAGWISWLNVRTLALELPDGSTSRAHLALRNVSDVPVYDIVVRYFMGDEPCGSLALPYLSPTGPEPHRKPIAAQSVPQALADVDDPRNKLKAELTFTDAHGRRWQRTQVGRLSRVDGRT